jgi:RNA polymerase sigma-70 factor (ECF subfamily)
LGDLSEADRELLTLIGWEELTPTEAAGALGISPLTARTRLHRARRRLRDRLAEQRSRCSKSTEIGVEEAR